MLNTNEKPREKFVEPDMASFSPKMVWLIDDDLAKDLMPNFRASGRYTYYIN